MARRLAGVSVLGLAIVALGATGASAQARAPDPVYREIRQWILGCDNTRRCTVRFVPSEFAPPAGLRGREAGLMSVTRDGGAGGEVTVRLSIKSRYDAASREKTLTRIDPSRLQLDGLALAARLDAPRRPGPVSEHVLTGPAAIQFLNALQGGSLLSLSSRPDSPLVSLEGLSDALVAMDQAQGRTGNQSALVHGAGAAPASATLPAAPPPLIKAAPMKAPLTNGAALAAQVRRAKTRILRQSGCDLSRSGDDAQPLNAREALVLLACKGDADRGAVLVFRVAIANPAAGRLLRLPLPRFVKDALEAEGEYGEGRYDPDSATFSQTTRGRPEGDCGLSASWVFDGRDFHLSELAYQDRCGGPAEDWPRLYRARVLELN